MTKPTSRGREHQAPVACDLLALTPSKRGKRAQLAAELRRGVVEVAELANGYALDLEPGSTIARQVQEFVSLERACCPFLTFTVREPDASGGPLRVEITGGEGTKEFLLAEFGLAGVE